MKQDNPPAQKCSVCGYALQPLHPEAPGQWQRCSRKLCGHIQREPIATDSSDSPLFTDVAPAPAANSLWGKIRGSFENKTQSASKDRELWERLYLPETPGKLLELGAGDPSAILNLTRLGWQQIEAWHLCPQAPQEWQEKGVSLKSGEPDLSSYPAESFDAVVLRWALEQSPEPLTLLKNAWRLLKPSGRFVLIAWNSNSLGCELFAAQWLPFTIAPHRRLYSPGSLRQSLALAKVQRKFALFTSFAGQLPQSQPPQPETETEALRQKALKQLEQDPLCGEALVLVADKAQTDD
ncbi:MAG: methyltransferase domain-containing protein [Verrucomicrobiota bacterium]|nr:methyltransferase domain-containing protein [Verrucomicrobiota bacterium]